jgi:hypothetical protein
VVGGRAQVVEHFPSKPKSLISNPSARKEKKEKKINFIFLK